MKNKGTMRGIEPTHFIKGKLVSTIIDLEEKGADIERDIFRLIVDDTDHVKVLERGTYKLFVYGKVVWDSNINPEFGTDDGEWIFEETEVRVTPVFPEPKTLQVKEGKR